MSERKLKVLLVDDEQIIREGLTGFIDWEAEGFRLIEAAENAAQAVECVQRNSPELVITDISTSLSARIG